MKFSMIWSLSGLSLRERINRTKELWWRKAAHRLPRRLAYWSFIDTGARTIGDFEIVPEVTFVSILSRMEN